MVSTYHIFIVIIKAITSRIADVWNGYYKWIINQIEKVIPNKISKLDTKVDYVS